MQFVIVLLIAAAVFGVCYLVDKGFSRACIKLIFFNGFICPC